MKTAEHVEFLLKQGKKPRELEELGFSKHIITRVRRQLKEEREQQKQTMQETVSGHKNQRESPIPHVQQPTGLLELLNTLDKKYGEVLGRLSAMEAAKAEFVSSSDLEERLAGTPALSLRYRYQCECGESGYVALRMQCTNCGRECWWGWSPEQ